VRSYHQVWMALRRDWESLLHLLCPSLGPSWFSRASERPNRFFFGSVYIGNPHLML
jgi:hypothetical protein